MSTALPSLGVPLALWTTLIWLASAVSVHSGEGPDRAPGAPADVTTYTVTNTTPSGPGSFAEAITRANETQGKARVAFTIPIADPGYSAADGVWTIRLSTSLPALVRGNITVDGTTQRTQLRHGKRAGPLIALAPEKEGVEYALSVVSAGNAIRGLAIGGFKYGIVLYGQGATRNEIAENHIGVSAAGDMPSANETGILVVEGANANTLTRNVISGNESLGVYIAGKESKRNVLRGNRIGCDASGKTRVPNGTGVMLSHCSETAIGGSNADDGNIIAGNDDTGVLLVGKWTTRNTIKGNLIGVDGSGTKVVYNDKGIVIKSLANENVVGGVTAAERNIISGNLEIGIYIEAADGNAVVGNYIGTDITGTKAVLDGELVQGNGVEFNTVAKNNVVGGLKPGERNIISGHKVYGVVYYGHCSQNSTLGNYIGTDITGNAALPNATGICVDCASHHNDIAQNVISGNLSYGMFFVTRGTEYNTLRGNKIGTNADGTVALPNDIGMVISTGASHNIVGGAEAADRNVISGNRQSGIMITNRFTEDNQIVGNYIGVDGSGTRPIPNKHGLLFSTYPKANLVKRNVISGNDTVGVLLYEYAELNELTGNYIGTDASGTKTIGNGKAGVVIDRQARNNVIGKPGAGNTIVQDGPGSIVVQEGAGPGNSFADNTVRGEAQQGGDK